MKNLSKKWLLIAALGALVLANAAFSFTDDDWQVPEEFVNLKNPVKADDESLDVGKMLYSKHCKSCHGKYGEGDGPKADELDTDCGDFTTEEFQEQTDGSLFYKTKMGRDDMPEFKKKIKDDEDIWHIVNYLRTLEE